MHLLASKSPVLHLRITYRPRGRCGARSAPPLACYRHPKHTGIRYLRILVTNRSRGWSPSHQATKSIATPAFSPWLFATQPRGQGGLTGRLYLDGIRPTNQGNPGWNVGERHWDPWFLLHTSRWRGGGHHRPHSSSPSTPTRATAGQLPEKLSFSRFAWPGSRTWPTQQGGNKSTPVSTGLRKCSLLAHE